MDVIHHEKTKDKEIQVPCKNCDRFTFHKVLHSVEHEYSDFLDDATFFQVFEIIICEGCRYISLRNSKYNSIDAVTNNRTGEVFFQEKVSLYPSRLAGRKPIEMVLAIPQNVRMLYEETHATLCNQYPVLTGIGIRTLVEAVCSEQKATGVNLEQKIDDLVTLGVLTKGNAERLHAIRFMGNKAAHEFTASPCEVDVAMDIVENLVMTIYIIPTKARRLKK
jgi:hypothetical protein